MSMIHVLKPEVAALIAAGEVVERPSSVIKELVENSIDAGAKSITVEIKNGGVSYMRVTDDGIGIEPDDIETAFLRHATSKILKSEDLESIVTLGFRGEALHSIAAVSLLEMMTLKRGNEEGVFAKLSAGEIIEISPVGCPVGTTIIIKDLFFNTPARMKFLKKDSTEAGHIEDLLRKIALGRPDISFKYINNGKEVFFTPGDNSLKNAVYAIYGKDIAGSMIEATIEADGVKVYGLIGKSELSRPNRNFQTFFVNGRCVINKIFYFALNESYKNQIMTGRFPVAVLNIEISPTLCDVNVHPAKAEIKFVSDKPVYDAIYWASKNALYNITEKREFTIKKASKLEFEQLQNVEQITIKPVTPIVKTVETTPVSKIKPIEYIKPAQTMKPIIEEKQNLVVKESTVPYTVSTATDEREVKEKIVDKHIKVLGQVFDTYLVAEYDGAMILVDQHAAHERMIYNRLLKMKDNSKIESQAMLIPCIAELTASEMSILKDKKDLLDKLGFEAEEFGNNAVRITAVPSALANDDIVGTLIEILEILSSSKQNITTETEDKILYSVACKAALKAGKKLSFSEQEILIKQILDLEGDPTCPHGRPVILRLTEYQIEKQFKRIV